jgi:selenoprotein W-related protein
LTGELLNKFEPEIASITLVPSEGGAFEVTVNDKLIYSKIETGRHVDPGEVVGLIQKILVSSQ